MNINKINKQIPDTVLLILDKLNHAGYEAYIVGGCVRDILMGNIPHDYDICTSALPNEIIKVFEGYSVIPTGIQHGTVTVMIDKIGYEITTYRIDGIYTDNRRPDNVSFTNNLKEDLQRRDFTINAMAYNPSIGLIDYFHGLSDLQNHILRCVGNPEDRFSEDALRILRLWRFSIQLDFYATDNTSNAAYLLKDNLKNISYERIQSEFVKALKCNKTDFGVRADWYLEAIIPEWKDMHFPQNNPYHVYDVSNHSLSAYDYLDESADLILRLATLLHDIGKPHCYQDDKDGIRHFKGHGRVSAEMVNQILKRLKFDNNTREKVVELVFYHDATFEETNKAVKRWLNKIGEEQLQRLLQLRKADIQAQANINKEERLKKLTRIKNIIDKVMTEQDCFKIKDLAINGYDLMNCGIPEGKTVGNILNSLLDLVIDGVVNNTRDELLKTVYGMFAANPQLYKTNKVKH